MYVSSIDNDVTRAATTGEDAAGHPAAGHPAAGQPLVDSSPFGRAEREWREEIEQQVAAGPTVRNRSGIPIEPLYTPRDWSGETI